MAKQAAWRVLGWNVDLWNQYRKDFSIGPDTRKKEWKQLSNGEREAALVNKLRSSDICSTNYFHNQESKPGFIVKWWFSAKFAIQCVCRTGT